MTELDSTNPSLLAAQPHIDPDGNLFLVVNSGHRGQARFSVSIADDGSSPGPTAGTVARRMPYIGRVGFSQMHSPPAAQEFSVCVVEVNQQPKFTVIPDIFAPSGTLARRSRIAFAFNVTAGTGDIGQTLTWVYSYDNPAIFVGLPILTVEEHWTDGSKLRVAGVMDVTVKADAVGHTNFTITLVDDGPSDPLRGDVNTSNTQSFRLTVVRPNYEPSFDLGISTIEILEDAGEQSLENVIYNIRAGPESEAWQVLSFSLHNISVVQSVWPAEGLFESFAIVLNRTHTRLSAGNMPCISVV